MKKHTAWQTTKNEEGFTLVGTLGAVIISGFVVLMIAQLMTRAQAVVDVGRERFVAVNLAREGLELVRAVRDTNWFAHRDKERWLENGICDTDGDLSLETDRQFAVDVEEVRTTSALGSNMNPALFIQSSNTWLHEIADRATPYQRVVSIDCSTRNEDQPFITVSSRVTWTSRGQDREVEVKEKLYNWIPDFPGSGNSDEEDNEDSED